jgi:two-component system chemotaxis response regulator CheB
MPIQVLIVDDSAVVRQVLQEQLSKHRDIEVQGVAPDPIFAMEKMKVRWPDVVILDIEMPRMDGITFLRKIMSTRPTPVIICSTLSVEKAELTLQALSAGAFTTIAKPRAGLKDFLLDSSEDLVSVVRAAARAKVDRIAHKAIPEPSIPPEAPASRGRPRDGEVRAKLSPDEMLPPPDLSASSVPMTEKIVAIGCSTGGTQALEQILRELPRTVPGIVVVQHMPEMFTRSFAERLDRVCEIEVREAADGDRIVPGLALIAPGGRHLLVVRSGAQYRVEVKDGPLISRHRPSVDVLFRSVARSAGRNATGFILTGMGDDGAHGMREMHEAGAVTYAQDEKSCVVFGMPKEAIRLGGVDHVVPLERMPAAIAAIYQKNLS